MSSLLVSFSFLFFLISLVFFDLGILGWILGLRLERRLGHCSKMSSLIIYISPLHRAMHMKIIYVWCCLTACLYSYSDAKNRNTKDDAHIYPYFSHTTCFISSRASARAADEYLRFSFPILHFPETSRASARAADEYLRCPWRKLCENYLTQPAALTKHEYIQRNGQRRYIYIYM